MKIYTKVVIDLETLSVIEEEGFEYDGEVAECKGGGGGSTVNSVDYKYNARMATLSEEQQKWAREYFKVWQQYYKPYEIAQSKVNMEMLPLESNLYKQQLNAATDLLPQQTEAAKKFLQASTSGVDINERMGLATADASSAWKDVNSQTARANARMGVNPNSGRFQGVNAALDTQKAAQLAGARTQARVGAEQENYERLAKASAFNPTGGILQGMGFIN